MEALLGAERCKGPADRPEQAIRRQPIEQEACLAVDDGVRQAARAVADRQRPEPLGVHLAEAAGLEARRHQREITAGEHAPGLRVLEAELDGDVYVVNGQKIWTSYAHAADWCFLLTRTDFEAKKHEGITILLVDMHTPGIEVREIPNPYGRHLIHEIHFADVLVPTSHRLGDENRGWEIVRSILANERVGIARHAHAEAVLDQTVRDAQDLGVDLSDPRLQSTLGTAYSWCEAARAMNYVAVAERIDDPLGLRPMASVSRSITGPMERETEWACQILLGDQALVGGTEADRQVVTGTTSMIAAGAYEVQLDLIAKNVLNLPRSR